MMRLFIIMLFFCLLDLKAAEIAVQCDLLNSELATVGSLVESGKSGDCLLLKDGSFIFFNQSVGRIQYIKNKNVVWDIPTTFNAARTLSTDQKYLYYSTSTYQHKDICRIEYDYFYVIDILTGEVKTQKNMLDFEKEILAKHALPPFIKFGNPNSKRCQSLLSGNRMGVFPDGRILISSAVQAALFILSADLKKIELSIDLSEKFVDRLEGTTILGNDELVFFRNNILYHFRPLSMRIERIYPPVRKEKKRIFSMRDSVITVTPDDSLQVYWNKLQLFDIQKVNEDLLISFKDDQNVFHYLVDKKAKLLKASPEAMAAEGHLKNPFNEETSFLERLWNKILFK